LRGGETAAKKTRLDTLLVDRGHAPTRAKAQALIRAGSVFHGTNRLDKPGTTVPADIEIEIRGKAHEWVSRGGLKLVHGLDEFHLEAANRVCLDIGASTGGFTDVLLARGAARVYAVDVGHGQLDWKLRNDARVVVLERTNARYLTGEQIPEPAEVIVCDASFIGLQTVLPAPLALAAEDAVLVALIKPQFEVGKGKVGKGGVVRDPGQHAEVCDRIRDWLDSLTGWNVLGITESPITGPRGNVEFLIAARREG